MSVKSGENPPPDFSRSKERDRLSLTGTQFSFGEPIRLWTTDPNVVSSLRRLRAIASQIHAVDAERDLFILERMAERGVHWNTWWQAGWGFRLFGWVRLNWR